MDSNNLSKLNSKTLKDKQQAKRKLAAEKRRKKTRDKHRMQGLEHTKKYKR